MEGDQKCLESRCDILDNPVGDIYIWMLAVKSRLNAGFVWRIDCLDPLTIMIVNTKSGEHITIILIYLKQIPSRDPVSQYPFRGVRIHPNSHLPFSIQINSSTWETVLGHIIIIMRRGLMRGYTWDPNHLHMLIVHHHHHILLNHHNIQEEEVIHSVSGYRLLKHSWVSSTRRVCWSLPFKLENTRRTWAIEKPLQLQEV